MWCVYRWVCVCVWGICSPWHAVEVRGHLDTSPWLSSHWRKNLCYLPPSGYSRLAGLWASGETLLSLPPVSPLDRCNFIVWLSCGFWSSELSFRLETVSSFTCWAIFPAPDVQYYKLMPPVLGAVRPLIYANQMILLFYTCNSYFDYWWSWGEVCLIKGCHEWVFVMIDRLELYKPFLTVHVPSHDASGFNQMHARSMHKM